MWPFKKYLPIDTLDDGNHKWSVGEVSGGAGPMIIRVNDTAKEWARHPSLEVRVGFAVPLNQKNAEGLPDPQENHELNHIEDVICARVRATGPSVQVLAITAGTFKEFVYYLSNGESIAALHKQISAEITTHEVQCVAERDPKWTVYKTFAK